MFIFEIMHSHTEENYLKALFLLSNQEDETGVKELGTHLGVKMPSVTSMMKKFEEHGWVEYQSYKPVKLTAEGKTEAALIIRKHRLTEMFLVEKMGFGWEQVHDIAEQIEHIKSPDFFKKMDELLGFPKFDPHGSPIPDRNGNIENFDYQKLSEMKAGKKVTFLAITNSSDDFLKFLNSRNLKLGTLITINGIEEFDGSMTLSYLNYTNEMFSKIMTDKLLVKEVED